MLVTVRVPSSDLVCQIADAHSHGAAAAPRGTTKKCFAASIDLCDHLAGSTIVVLLRSSRILI
jgi:hypothetical protein